MRFTAGLLTWVIWATGTILLAQPTSANRYLIRAVPVAPVGETGRRISLAIRDSVTGEARQFIIPSATPYWVEEALRMAVYKVDAFLVTETRALVRETLKFGEVVSVVDLTTGRLMDRISGYRVVLSPDNTRAIYTYFFPPRIDADHTVLAYDFTQSPNRSAMLLAVPAPGDPGKPDFQADSPTDPRLAQRGAILYPPGNRASQRFFSKSDPVLRVTSPFAWCGNDRVAFLVARGPETSLVTMYIPANLMQARMISEQRLDRRPFLLPEYREGIPPDRPEYQKAPIVARALSFDNDCASVSVHPFYMGPFLDHPVNIPLAPPEK